MLEDIRKAAVEYAEDVDSAKLLRAVMNPITAANYLNLLTKDEDFAETTVSNTRTDVKTIKKNITRWNEMYRWVKQEKELENSPYLRIYEAEREALDVYMIQAIVDIYKADNTIFNHLKELEAKLAEEAAEKAAERKKKNEEKKAAKKNEK